MDNESPSPKSRLAADAPTRKPRGFKIAIIILLLLLILFAGAIYLLPHILPVGAVKAIAQSKAKELAGVDVDFSNLRFGWNGDVVIDDVTVAPLDADGAPGEPLLTVKEVRTNIALTPLLQGKAVVNSVDVNGFVLKVRRAADGSLNIPDFSKLGDQAQAAAPARRRPGLIPLSAAEEQPGAEEAASTLPPIEIRKVSLKNGVIGLDDAITGISHDMGVDSLDIEGKTLDDPFVLSGRLLPHDGQPDLGECVLTGHVAMLRGGQLDLDGEASLEVQIKNLLLHEMVEKFGLGDLLRSGQADGLVKVAYSGQKGGLAVPELRLTRTSLGLGDGAPVAIPDSIAAVAAEFDPAQGVLTLSEASITNDIAAIRANGHVADVENVYLGGMPSAAFDFSGAVNFAHASHYASSSLNIDSLPELDGKASFFGKAVLPPGGHDVPLAPTFSLDINDGTLQALDNATGIIVGIDDLKGVALRAAAVLAGEPEINASLALANVPGKSFVQQISHDPVTFVLNGGAAVVHSADASAVELRFNDSSAGIPATPWAAAAAVREAKGQINFDLLRDTLRIDGLSATINDVVRCGVVSGNVTGVMAGAPAGQADLELAALMEHVKELLAPVFPHALVPQLTGSLQGAARIKLADGEAEALVRGQIANSRGVIQPNAQSQAEFQTPATNLSLLATARLDAPGGITIQSVEATTNNTAVRYGDAVGGSMTGSVGNGVLKAAGVIDADAGLGRFSVLSFDVDGMNLALGKDGQEVAAVSSGILKAVAATPEAILAAPLSGAGDFAVPSLDLGVDNLVFAYNGEQSRFGNVRAKLSVDGYIGSEKRQLVNIKTASLSAAPLAVNSRGQFDLGTGAMLVEYAARAAPSGISSLLAYAGLPPSLLGDAAVTGLLGFNGNQVSSKGTAQGRLQTGQGESSPFEMAHELSAAWDADAGSLVLDIRRLDGNVKTASGQPVATMAAQQSKLLLSRAGSQGLLDIRVNGAAGPSRNLLLGIASVVPQLNSLAQTLNSAQADGIYNAWLQVKDQDAGTLGINVGGEWQGAALSIGGTPYLSEAAKLSANLIGELAYQNNQFRLSRLFLRSDSGLMQADGTATVTYTADESHMPTGFAHLETDLRFVLADLSKAGLVFPGVIPPDLGVTGRVDGVLRANGDANNVAIEQGVVNFQQFRAAPSQDLVLTIPAGSANFDGVISLHMNGVANGSPYDALTMLDVRNGKASMQGLMVRDKAVNELAAAFQLENGVLNLESARLSIGGGSEGGVQAAGTVNFTSPQPAVALRLAMRNIPLLEINSETRDYFTIESGSLNLPAQEGQSAAVAFSGFDVDNILRTIRLDNFNFATSRVVLVTGPALNAELDKARVIMRQNQTADKTRRVTFSSITGTAQAAGDGTIYIPDEAPIDLVGEDTGDFRARGNVYANHTMDMKVMVAGKLEKLIGFTIPNLIPKLATGEGETSNRLMSAMNDSAAKGKYSVHVKGSLAHPDISGIGAVAGQFIQDILKSELLGGVLDLGKDAPQALLNLGGNVLENVLNPADTLKNAPENLIHAPENVVKGLGQMFGVGGQSQGDGQDVDAQQQQQDRQSTRDAVKGLGQMFGIGGGQRDDQQEQQQEEQQDRRRPRLPFGIH